MYFFFFRAIEKYGKRLWKQKKVYHTFSGNTFYVSSIQLQLFKTAMHFETVYFIHLKQNHSEKSNFQNNIICIYVW